MSTPEPLPPEPFSAALVPFPVQDNLPGLPTPQKVREGLAEQFHLAVQRERDSRGEVTSATQVWPMVRAVEGFRSLVGDYARALTAVSDSAKAVLEDELFEANGEQDGIPNGPLNVPDGGGRVIAVRAKTQNQHDIDADQVIGCLAALVSTRWARDHARGQGAPTPAEQPVEFAIAVARRALEMVGAADLKITHVKALAMELGQVGEDRLAACALDAIRSKRLFKGVTVEHKDAPRSKREAS